MRISLLQRPLGSPSAFLESPTADPRHIMNPEQVFAFGA
jgi:hypothetical protein